MKTSNLIQPSMIRPTIIKKSGAILLSAFCVLGFASCENEDDEPITDAITQQDRNFAISSSQFMNAQIAMGQLGAERGSDDSVLDYSQMIIDDNTEAKSELVGILDSKEVDYADDITAEMQTIYDELALLEGQAFDEAFVDYQISNLDNSISMFENQVDNGQNFTIKGFAEKTLETVREHRNRAVVVRTEIDIENL